MNESRSSLRAGSILSVVNTPPFMQKWNPYDPNEYDEQAYGARILNPLAANAADSNTNTDHINGSLGFTVDIYKGLKFKTTFGIELTNEHWDYYWTRSQLRTDAVPKDVWKRVSHETSNGCLRIC